MLLLFARRNPVPADGFLDCHGGTQPYALLGSFEPNPTQEIFSWQTKNH